ncbi:MAG: GvpL/GvpF family gas vesicle protein [Nitrospinae bacterium]|nr:GvpL/GvpF family gas vesicle protein [Nitrospinota bacterium]
MDGLYLYCIREKIEGAEVFSMKGIDGKGEIFTLAYREVEAVVSEVLLKEFQSGEIRRKAREDLSWIKEKAIVHEKIIEKAMRKNGKFSSLIPMRFGAIFRDTASLEDSLNRDYHKIREALDRIRYKQEWGVKVYLRDREKFEQVVMKGNKKIKEIEKEIASLPEGMAYFMEGELKEVIFREQDKELCNMEEALLKNLGRQAAAFLKCKILEREITGRGEPMVLNVAYLIPDEKEEDFKRDAGRLNREIQTKGFYLEYSGPWPAFNFSEAPALHEVGQASRLSFA